MRSKLFRVSILALLILCPSVIFCSEELTDSDSRTLIDSDSFINNEEIPEDSQDVSQSTDGVLYEDESGSPILAEPLVDDDEEVVVLDENSRIVAEQLIHKLDDLSEKLSDENETIGDSRAISSADIDSLEQLLQAAGFGKSPDPDNQKEDVPQAAALGGMPTDLGALGGLGGLGALGALGGGLGGLGALGGMGGMVPPTSMTKRKIEEIKGELRYMLFGPEVVKRRQDYFPPAGHPEDRRRPPGPGPGPGPGPLSRRRVQSSGFLSSFRNRNRKPDPKPEFNRNGNFPLQQGSAPVPGFVGNGRPPHPNGGPPPPNVRAPINEFRPQPSSFRLPADASLNQHGPANFNPPPNNFRSPQFLPGGPGNNKVNPQLSAPPPLRIPPPNQGPPQRPHFQPSKPANPPVFRPSETIPRPGLVETEGFRPISPDAVPKQQQPPPAGQQRPSLNNNAVKVGASIRTGNQNPNQFTNRPNSFNNAPPQLKNNEPDCASFMDSVCLEARNYPRDMIMAMLKRNPISEVMLAEVRSQSADDLIEGISAADERKYTYSHYYGNRRQGEDTHAHRDFAADGGFLCPSEVRYAKPQLAQNSRGTWKYIVNVEEHTQTVRMEHCLKPAKGCSYVSPHYKSQCAQLYNYHRLMSWDEQRGLHVDIYKIPAACTCHINGYTHNYPPLDGKPFEQSPASGRSASNSSSSSSRKSPGSRVKFPDKPERPPAESTSAPRSPATTSASPTRNFGFDSDFGSFIENFSGPFGSFPTNAFGKRADDNPEVKYSDSQAVEDVIRQKTNYDYHPIIEFFQNRDKPKRN